MIQLSAPEQRKQPCGTKSGWRLPYRAGALPSTECAMIHGAANGIMHSICARSMNWPLPVSFVLISAVSTAAQPFKPPTASPNAVWLMTGGPSGLPITLGRPEPCSRVEP